MIFRGSTRASESFQNGRGRPMEKILSLKNDFSEIERLSNAVKDLGEKCRCPGELVDDVVLALEEIVSNIVRHGGESIDNRLIRVEVRTGSEEWTCRVIDEGRPFNPLEFPAPDLDTPFEERDVGGMGIHLVRRSVDGMEYERKCGKNVLIMKKSMSREP